jgi:hypothetical protein
MMAVMATSAAAGWYPDPNGQPGLRYFDGTHWTEHRKVLTANPPPPDDYESRYSDAVERVLQVFIDTYNNAYAESVATGRMFTTTEMAKGFTDGISQFHPNPEDQIAGLAAMLVKAIEKLPRPGNSTSTQSQAP